MKGRCNVGARVSRQLEACLQFHVSLYWTADEPIDRLKFGTKVVPDSVFPIQFCVREGQNRD